MTEFEKVFGPEPRSNSVHWDKWHLYRMGWNAAQLRVRQWARQRKKHPGSYDAAIVRMMLDDVIDFCFDAHQADAEEGSVTT